MGHFYVRNIGRTLKNLGEKMDPKSVQIFPSKIYDRFKASLSGILPGSWLQPTRRGQGEGKGGPLHIEPTWRGQRRPAPQEGYMTVQPEDTTRGEPNLLWGGTFPKGLGWRGRATFEAVPRPLPPPPTPPPFWFDGGSICPRLRSPPLFRAAPHPRQKWSTGPLSQGFPGPRTPTAGGGRAGSAASFSNPWLAFRPKRKEGRGGISPPPPPSFLFLEVPMMRASAKRREEEGFTGGEGSSVRRGIPPPHLLFLPLAPRKGHTPPFFSTHGRGRLAYREDVCHVCVRDCFRRVASGSPAAGVSTTPMHRL